MKLSKYNCIYNINQNSYAINLLSGGIVKIDKEKIKNLLQNDGIFDEKILDEDEIDFLKKGRFILEDEIDELTLLKIRYRKSKEIENNELKLSIIPSYSCNFDCSYCYQRQLEKKGYKYNNGKMSDELLNSVEQYLNKVVSVKKKLHIEWFGGEPLLFNDLIIDFNYKIKDICEENGCEFYSSIVSNGYLLTLDNTKRLYNSGVRGALITVDGPEKIHNKRRYLKDGSGSFDKIINNIINASKYLDINVRINMDTQNYNEVEAMLKYLSETNINKKNIQIIFTTTTFDDDLGKDMKMLNLEELKKAILDITNTSKKLGFKCELKNLCKPNVCVARKANSYVLDLDGNVYKCPSLAGHPSIADGKFNIETSQIELSYNGLLWSEWEPFDDAKCTECKYLPMCFGGCTYEKMINKYKFSNQTKDLKRYKYACNKYMEEIINVYIRNNI